MLYKTAARGNSKSSQGNIRDGVCLLAEVSSLLFVLL